jgi:16S rRNA (cytosine967-C5)-methyltransferase
MNPRAIAARIIDQVCSESRSLSQAMEAVPPAAIDDRALIQEMCYGTLRNYHCLALIIDGLLKKPLKAKDGDVQALLLLGLYQLMSMRVPDHAAVSETVAATVALKKPWARGLVNGVLRNFLREGQQLTAKAEAVEEARWAHPQWFIDAVRKAWPDDWQAVLTANNQRPPMTLRVNQSQGDEAAYLAELSAVGIEAKRMLSTPGAIQLGQPVDVAMLPGFGEGRVSVQDAAAQWAAQLLRLEPGQRVLDVCAAPGGKTGHILEMANVEMVAVDIDPERLKRIEENLVRLGKTAHLIAGDAGDPSSWWDGSRFDRILLDAPCSATGVIRRHPDIKLLRRAGDIQTLVECQAQILDAMWPLLKPGGMLLYATCSVLPQENADQIAAFVSRQADAQCREIDADWGRRAGFGRQTLPGEGEKDSTENHIGGMDGFYYACLEKQP